MRFGKTKINLKKGDITQETADILVNAANSSLLGGGGVDGAIHRVGGSQILDECQKIRSERGRCLTGEAVMTGAGNLKAKRVIHAVGPVWHGGTHHEPEHLKSAYTSSLLLAKKAGAKTICFPSISTGAYGYPIENAAKVALKTVLEFIQDYKEFEEIRFILFSDHDLSVYQQAISELKS